MSYIFVIQNGGFVIQLYDISGFLSYIFVIQNGGFVIQYPVEDPDTSDYSQLADFMVNKGPDAYKYHDSKLEKRELCDLRIRFVIHCHTFLF